MKKNVNDVRLKYINEDIHDSIAYEKEYREIKCRYEEATTDDERQSVIDEHDRLREEEEEYMRKALSALKNREFFK